MMGIVTGCNRESPLGFRANPRIGGAARRRRRRRIRAQYAVIAALISTVSSVVGAAQLSTSNMTATPAAWQKSAADDTFTAEHYGQGLSVSSEHRTVLTALIRPAPLGEITPDPPPEVPPPTGKPLVPSVAAPPPRAEQPLSPPRQEDRPPPQQQAPAPQQQAPAPGQEAPPAQPPPRGHVQLAP
jgi:hypothetical protein